MKILIIGFAKIKYMPYLNLYLENIDRDGNDVHLIYWNRDLKEENLEKLQGITLHEFNCLQQDDAAKLSKIESFKKFRDYAVSVLKEGFDFAVVLHSLPGVLLSKELIGTYKNRYIFDYRDFTYENFLPYKSVIQSLVKNSYRTFVSSDAFRAFLPDSKKVLTSHSVLSEDLFFDSCCKKEKSEKIRIGFWGFIREEKINSEIIKKLGNDPKFELHYYGREQAVAENLKAFAKENALNVFFHGEYNPSQRYEFIKNTDVIHNIYGESNMNLAVSNKYYDGALFRIPQLVMKNSFMGVMAQNTGIGCAVNPFDEDFGNKIFEYYQSIDKKAFNKSCEKVVNRVKTEQSIIAETVRNIK